MTFWTLCSVLLGNEVRVVASVASPPGDASKLFLSYFSIGLRGVGNRPLRQRRFADDGPSKVGATETKETGRWCGEFNSCLKTFL